MTAQKATAYIRTDIEKTPVTVVKEVEVRRVVLTLTQEQAETLLLITRHVGGSPHGRRMCIESIRDALLKAGVTEAKFLGPFGTSSHNFRGSADLTFREGV